MKVWITTIAMMFTINAKSQSIEFKLSGVYEKKWIGHQIYDQTIDNNNEIITFKHSHFVTIQSYRPNMNKTTAWRLEKGKALTENIVIRIDNVPYSVEFSETSTNQEMLTLTKITFDEDEPVITKTYVAQN